MTLLPADERSAQASCDTHGVWGHFVGQVSKCPDENRDQPRVCASSSAQF